MTENPFGVETGDATDVSDTGATLSGELTGLGDGSSAKVFVVYWKQGQKETTTKSTVWKATELTEPGEFTHRVGGLEPGTTYEFLARGNADGVGWSSGDPVSFTTESPFAVETGDATEVGTTEATLGGEVTGLGGASSAKVFVVYWKQGQKETTTKSTVWKATELTGPGAFTHQVGGLEPGTTYEFLARGNADGVGWSSGDPEQFTTGTGG
jgi:subtilisin